MGRFLFNLGDLSCVQRVSLSHPHILLADAYHSFMGDSDPVWTGPCAPPGYHRQYTRGRTTPSNTATTDGLISCCRMPRCKPTIGRSLRHSRSTAGMGRGCGKERPPVKIEYGAVVFKSSSTNARSGTRLNQYIAPVAPSAVRAITSLESTPSVL